MLTINHYKENKQLLVMIDRIKQQEDVTGITLFGSWARGNQRVDSDIDLLVTKENKSFHRKIETIENQKFEIVYNSSHGTLSFWKSYLDSSKRFWE